MNLKCNQILYLKTPLDLSFSGRLSDLSDNPMLKFGKLIPQKSSSISENTAIIPQIKRRDILLSYPYESIRPFINLLNEAANDPKVTEIKITLYRLAKNSQIIAALCDAAENRMFLFLWSLEHVLTRKIISVGQEDYKTQDAELCTDRENLKSTQSFSL